MGEPDEARADRSAALQPDPGPGTLAVVLGGILDHDMVPMLVERMCALLDSTKAVQVVCDVTAVTAPDAVAVEALARLQLAARRRGLRLWLRDGDGYVRTLMELSGLHEVVPLWPRS